VSLPASDPTSKITWHVAHLLSIGPIVVLGLFAYVAFAYDRTGHVLPPSQAISWIGRLAIPATFAFWIWMLRDHFRAPRNARAAGWSVALIALSWGAAFGNGAPFSSTVRYSCC